MKRFLSLAAVSIGLLFASGPTIPPGPWDDGDVKPGQTSVVVQFDIEMPTCYPCDTK